MATTTPQWILKTEPETYSFQKFLQDKTTFWDGVRNYQARNFIAQMRSGQRAFIYHSGKEKAIVGLAEVIGNPEADIDPSRQGSWLKIRLKATQSTRTPLTLNTMKTTSELSQLPLLKQPRLSITPLTEHESAWMMQYCFQTL